MNSLIVVLHGVLKAYIRSCVLYYQHAGMHALDAAVNFQFFMGTILARRPIFCQNRSPGLILGGLIWRDRPRRQWEQSAYRRPYHQISALHWCLAYQCSSRAFKGFGGKVPFRKADWLTFNTCHTGDGWLLRHLQAGLIKLNSVVVQTRLVFAQMVTYMTGILNG